MSYLRSRMRARVGTLCVDPGCPDCSRQFFWSLHSIVLTFVRVSESFRAQDHFRRLYNEACAPGEDEKVRVHGTRLRKRSLQDLALSIRADGRGYTETVFCTPW